MVWCSGSLDFSQKFSATESCVCSSQHTVNQLRFAHNLSSGDLSPHADSQAQVCRQGNLRQHKVPAEPTRQKPSPFGTDHTFAEPGGKERRASRHSCELSSARTLDSGRHETKIHPGTIFFKTPHSRSRTCVQNPSCFRATRDDQQLTSDVFAS